MKKIKYSSLLIVISLLLSMCFCLVGCEEDTQEELNYELDDIQFETNIEKIYVTEIDEDCFKSDKNIDFFNFRDKIDCDKLEKNIDKTNIYYAKNNQDLLIHIKLNENFENLQSINSNGKDIAVDKFIKNSKNEIIIKTNTKNFVGIKKIKINSINCIDENQNVIKYPVNKNNIITIMVKSNKNLAVDFVNLHMENQNIIFDFKWQNNFNNVKIDRVQLLSNNKLLKTFNGNTRQINNLNPNTKYTIMAIYYNNNNEEWISIEIKTL